jgi:N-methylhydantoinase A/oxoprolinase/acetone carboxylase beta subunit
VPAPGSLAVGVDTGGTFTDLVTAAGDVRKVPSTPDAPADAVVGALTGVTTDQLAHGTTVATNALLQRRLARVALVTTRGFADVIEIARQARPSLYDQHVDRPPALVPRELRFEANGRRDGRGRELEPCDGMVPPALRSAVGRGDVDAVAVCLLHADLDPAHERVIASALAGMPVPVRCSHQVAPEFREYERTVTTVVDAGLGPLCAGYLAAVGELAPEVLVMTSAGGLVPMTRAAERPASLLLSGPAAGVRAAAAVARACGFPDAVSFDMGGTSTDACLVRDGMPDPAPALVVGGYPVRLPSLAVHTIGAGGGSVAAVDPGGALTVGPNSAGAVPGPAAYGLGGLHATVTDADLVLGRIPHGTALPGIGVLALDGARRVLSALGIGSAEDAASQVVRVVDAEMARAVRRVSAERGVDPRGLALVAFGGAGPLHACTVADELGMAAVVVPARAGVFSAVGLLCSPRQEEVVRSWPDPTRRDGIDAALAVLAADVSARVGGGPANADATAVAALLDCRYRGQSHELTVAHAAAHPAWVAFHDEHELRNGFARRDAAVEVVALRARASSAPPLAVDALPPPEPPRATVRGPAVVAEPDCTVWVPEGWTARPAPTGAWVITRA